VLFVGPALAAAANDKFGVPALSERIAHLPDTSTVVFTQPEAFDRLAGQLQPRPTLLAAEPKLLTLTGDRSLYRRLSTGLDGAREVVVVVDSTEPVSPVSSAVQRWLVGQYDGTGSFQIGSFQFSQFARAPVSSERALNSRFGDALRLAGVRPSALNAKPGSTIAVTEHWVAEAAVPADFTLSIQLLDSTGKLISQHDSFPVEGTMPTSLWRVGEAVYDTVSLAIPSDATPGVDSVSVVVYSPSTLQRLLIGDLAGSRDHVTVASVTVSR
jgi:hypothetical protein